MRKRILTAIFAIIVLSSIAVLGSTTEWIDRILESVGGSLSGNAINSKQSHELNVPLAGEQPEVASIQTTPDDVNVKRIGIPDEILWQVILGFPERLATLAENARAAGQNDILYTEYFTRQAHLSAENAAIFKRKALEYSAEIGPLNDRVQTIGLYFKGLRDKGKKQSKDQSYELRKELLALQDKQKEIVLKYREEFRNAVDAGSFDRFEIWLNTEFAANFSSKRITPNDLKTNPISHGPNNGFESIKKNKQEDNQK